MVPVGADQRLHPRALAARVTANTVLLVASAPGFPHGLVDDVQGIARLARRKGGLEGERVRVLGSPYLQTGRWTTCRAPRA